MVCMSARVYINSNVCVRVYASKCECVCVSACGCAHVYVELVSTAVCYTSIFVSLFSQAEVSETRDQRLRLGSCVHFSARTD